MTANQQLARIVLAAMMLLLLGCEMPLSARPEGPMREQVSEPKFIGMDRDGVIELLGPPRYAPTGKFHDYLIYMADGQATFGVMWVIIYPVPMPMGSRETLHCLVLKLDSTARVIESNYDWSSDWGPNRETACLKMLVPAEENIEPNDLERYSTGDNSQ